MNYFIKLGREFGHAYMSFFNSLDEGSERMQIDLGFYGSDNLVDSWDDKYRLGYELYLMFKLFVNGEKFTKPLSDIIAIVMKNYFSILPNKVIDQLLKSAGLLAAHVAGRNVAGNILTRIVIGKIVHQALPHLPDIFKGPNITEKDIMKVADKTISVFIIESIFNASEEDANYLASNFPDIYSKLKAKNVEMLFFIVRKPLQKYLDLIKLYKTNKRMFDDGVKRLYRK